MAAARLVQLALTLRLARFSPREMYIIYAGGQRGSERPLIGLAAWLVFELIST